MNYFELATDLARDRAALDGGSLRLVDTHWLDIDAEQVRGGLVRALCGDAVTPDTFSTGSDVSGMRAPAAGD